MRVHTRNTSDVGDGLNPNIPESVNCQDDDPVPIIDEPDGSKNDDEIDEATISKTNAIIVDMAKPFFHTWRTVTFDNWYGGSVPLIMLLTMGVLARCTFRMSRKHVCKYVKMKKTDSKKYPRGSYKVATCQKYGLSCYGWLDGNPVHLMTTADGTGTSSVFRQIGKEKKLVHSPKMLPEYVKSMQAVDRVDQLMSLFSLAKRHQFKKFYKNFMLALFDMAIVNADIHYHLANPSAKNKKDH